MEVMPSGSRYVYRKLPCPGIVRRVVGRHQFIRLERCKIGRVGGALERHAGRVLPHPPFIEVHAFDGLFVGSIPPDADARHIQRPRGDLADVTKYGVEIRRLDDLVLGQVDQCGLLFTDPIRLPAQLFLEPSPSAEPHDVGQGWPRRPIIRPRRRPSKADRRRRPLSESRPRRRKSMPHTARSSSARPTIRRAGEPFQFQILISGAFSTDSVREFRRRMFT